jgi:2-keto-4-pentenoate hydratase/2-oxohepta-3-ene-1,7-dioic acid hydratase in catechol pathway
MNQVIYNGHKVTPSKIICIGWNFVDHIKELENEFPEEPTIFIKPNSALSDDLIARDEKGFHYEGEISFLVRDKKLKGIGFGLDLTKRLIQNELKEKGLPWERAKSFDNSAVFSDFLPLREKLSSLGMELWINQLKVQAAGYELMIYKPEQILEEISNFISLENNDIIMMGTPKGVGEFKKGDIFSGKIFSQNTLIIEKTWIAE